MVPEPTLESVLRDLAMRIGAAVVVVGIFFGLGYMNRTDFLGLSDLLGNQLVFFGCAFLLVGVAALGWVLLQRSRA
ncbi:hypothetical protein [Haloglomus litoreum]|uniref:hypothetical protein n=1 Tax=Haloglomus litoreum TaxID=3034026 RepID=UPI0023E89E7F|nr:hypothetical protein [Haloglomus sp. DT116]